MGAFGVYDTVKKALPKGEPWQSHKNLYKTQKPAWQRVFVYRGVGKYIKW